MKVDKTTAANQEDSVPNYLRTRQVYAIRGRRITKTRLEELFPQATARYVDSYVLLPAGHTDGEAYTMNEPPLTPPLFIWLLFDTLGEQGPRNTYAFIQNVIKGISFKELREFCERLKSAETNYMQQMESLREGRTFTNDEFHRFNGDLENLSVLSDQQAHLTREENLAFVLLGLDEKSQTSALEIDLSDVPENWEDVI